MAYIKNILKESKNILLNENLAWKTPSDSRSVSLQVITFMISRMVLQTVNVYITRFCLTSCNSYKEMKLVCCLVHIPVSIALADFTIVSILLHLKSQVMCNSSLDGSFYTVMQ